MDAAVLKLTDGSYALIRTDTRQIISGLGSVLEGYTSVADAEQAAEDNGLNLVTDPEFVDGPDSPPRENNG